MKAIRISKTGCPDVLYTDNIPEPAPAPGTVRIQHTAIGVNFIDTYKRSGLYQIPLPSGLGEEAVGIIDAVGKDVPDFHPGDRVGYCGVPGSYAEKAVVPARAVISLPEGISDETAAASMLKGFTAHYLLRETFKVKAGQTILIHAAAGGVGLIAGQWAKAIGARVIGTVGSEAKKELARANGYDVVFNSRSEDWVKGVRDLTAGKGVPVVYDSIGKDTFEGSLNCLARRGLMVTFGNASGAVPPFAPALLNQKGSLYITRPTLADYISTEEELRETAEDFFTRVKNGTVKIHIGQRFKLSDAAKAHAALESRNTTGSTILLP